MISAQGRGIRGWGAVSLAIAALMSSTAAVGDVDFRGLGTVEPGLPSFVQGMSRDGTTPVGWAQITMDGGGTAGHAVRYSAGAELVPLLPGLTFTRAYAASLGGGVVIGDGTYQNTTSRAFRFSGGDVTLLPLLAGATGSFARDITPGGGTIVGSSGSRPVMWTGAASPVEVPIPAGVGPNGMASAVSADGARIAGHANTSPSVPQAQAFVWTSGSGTQMIPPPTGYVQTLGVGISGDGATALIQAQRDDIPLYDSFTWTDAGGLAMLPGLPGFVETRAWDSSEDGSVIVGHVLGQGTRAVMWRDGAIFDLNVLLPSLGVDLTGWTLYEARAVSADVMTIAGHGQHVVDGSMRVEAWVVTIPGPGAVWVAVVGGLVVMRRRR